MDTDFDGYDRAVDAHIKRLRMKLDVGCDGAPYIQTVWGVGYKFGGQSDAATAQ